MSYKITVAEQPARNLAGLCARINISDSQKECSALWEKFWPSMEKLAPIAEEGSFGVSINMDEKGNYDYWAAMATPPGAEETSGMSCLEVRGGKYAACTIENLADIGEVYQYIYSEWEKTQSDYRVDPTGAWLEFYQKDWQDEDPVTLYVALK